MDMHCPFCQNEDTKVVDTRINDDGHSIRRRRECPVCGKRFTTVETTMLLVKKRSGNVEPFDRAKVISGVRKACQGRPIDEDELKLLGQKVEEDLRSRGLAQIKSEEIGKAILEPLRELDEVAYLRFASVYQNFEGLADFQAAIDRLKGGEGGPDVANPSSRGAGDTPQTQTGNTQTRNAQTGNSV
jgi:transcriptional repressor NrdR